MDADNDKFALMQKFNDYFKYCKCGNCKATRSEIPTADGFCSCGCARNVHYMNQEAVNTARNGQLSDFIKINQMFPAAAAAASCSSGSASSSESAVPPRPSPTRRRGEHGSVHKELSQWGPTRKLHSPQVVWLSRLSCCWLSSRLSPGHSGKCTWCSTQH